MLQEVSNAVADAALLQIMEQSCGREHGAVVRAVLHNLVSAVRKLLCVYSLAHSFFIGGDEHDNT